MRLRKLFSFVVRPLPPFSFKLTVRKPAKWYWLNLFEIYQHRTLWTGSVIGGEEVGFKLKDVGSVDRPRVLVEVFGKSTIRLKKEVKWLIGYALGVDEDLRTFYEICDRYEILRKAREDLYGMKTRADPVVFHKALLAICLQMAPLKRSTQMLECICKGYGKQVKFNGKSLIIWPKASELASVEKDELRSKCKLGYRAKYISKISELAAKGKLPSTRYLLSMGPSEAKRELLKLPGIGDYSADILSPHAGLPLDVWSVKLFCKLFRIPMKKPARDMIPIVKQWAKKEFKEHVRRAFVYVVHELALRRLDNEL